MKLFDDIVTYAVLTTICLFVVGWFIIGCSMTPVEIQDFNKNSSQNPIVVAENTPKGKLYCISVRNSEDNCRYHYIYWFENDTNKTVSVNHSEMQGKMQVNKVEVIINGTVYVPKK